MTSTLGRHECSACHQVRMIAYKKLWLCNHCYYKHRCAINGKPALKRGPRDGNKKCRGCHDTRHLAGYGLCHNCYDRSKYQVFKLAKDAYTSGEALPESVLAAIRYLLNDQTPKADPPDSTSVVLSVSKIVLPMGVEGGP